MQMLNDTLGMMLEGIIGTVFTAFVTVSVVLFIVDGIKAKRQHRKRKTGITVMFIIAIICEVIFCVLVGILAAAIASYISHS